MVFLTKENLELCFEMAKEENAKYIGVVIEIRGLPDVDVNIIPVVNADIKLAYFRDAFDNDLTSVLNDGIKVKGFTFGNTFAELESDLM